MSGIQLTGIEELLDNGSQTLVLSREMLLVLRTCKETIEYLEKRSIPVQIAETNAAVKIYNGLVMEGKAVGDLFRSTC